MSVSSSVINQYYSNQILRPPTPPDKWPSPLQSCHRGKFRRSSEMETSWLCPLEHTTLMFWDQINREVSLSKNHDESLPERKLLINPPFSCAGLCTLSRVIWSSRWSVAKPGSCLENSTMSWTVRIVISVMCLNLMSLVSSPSKLNWRKETEATWWGNDRKWFTRSKGTLMVRVFRYTVSTSSVYLQVKSVKKPG